jgi:hypothetical protein
LADPAPRPARAARHDSHLDGLARSLAQPIPRRRALAIWGGTFAALMLPRVRVPTPAFAQATEVVCYPESEKCRAATCPPGTRCCFDTPGTCPGTYCCPICDPRFSQCSPGYELACRPGPIATSCCTDQGKVPCGDSTCCERGQACADAEAGICCTAIGALSRIECGKCYPPYAREVEKRWKRDVRDCKRSNPIMASWKGMHSPSWARWRRGACIAGSARDKVTELRYRCPQIQDHTRCGPNGWCRQNTLSCCAGPTEAQAATVTDVPARDEPYEPIVAKAGAGRVSNAELLRRLRRAAPSLNRAASRFDAAQEVLPNEGSAILKLEAAAKTYHRELRRTRRRLAAGRGGRAQRLLVSAFDASAGAVDAYRKAIVDRPPNPGRLLSQSAARWKRADGYMDRARKALG